MSVLAVLVVSAFAASTHTTRVAVAALAPKPVHVAVARPAAPATVAPLSPQGQADIGAARRARECKAEYPSATLEECDRERQDEANKEAAHRGETAPYPTGQSPEVEQAELREQGNRILHEP